MGTLDGHDFIPRLPSADPRLQLSSQGTDWLSHVCRYMTLTARPLTLTTR